MNPLNPALHYRPWWLLILLIPLGLHAGGGDTVRVQPPRLKGQDAVVIIREALDLCRKKKHPVLIFAAGRYDLFPYKSALKVYYESNTTAINPKRCPILLEGFKDLTLDAQGSSFICHDRMQPFTIDNSQGVTLKNFSIDWDFPLMAQALVTDTAAGYVDLKIDTLSYPFVIEGGKLLFTGEGWKSPWWGAMEFEAQSHLIATRTGDEGVFGEGFEQHYSASLLPGGLVRLAFAFRRRPAIGNILVLRHSERDHAGIFITGSRDIRLENIRVYHTAGLGILSQYSENLSFNRLEVVPNAAKGRLFSGHDDGCHFSNCRGKILVENCVFAGLMDDPINVHGTSVQVIEKKSARLLRCRFMHEQSTGLPWARPGDSIGFINHLSMQTRARGRVSRFTALGTLEFLVEFSEDLPASLGDKDALENLTWTPDLRVSHCFFSVNRARGILISTPGKVVIEDNTFKSSGSAILIAGDANEWFESGAVQDVLIERNHFLDACLTSMYQFCEALISIEPEIPVLDSNAPFHRNIRITQNDFNPYDYPVLFARSVEGLSFTDNTITRSHRFTPFHPSHWMFRFQGCKQVLISGNQLQGEVLGRNIRLEQMDPAELRFSPDLQLQTLDR